MTRLTDTTEIVLPEWKVFGEEPADGEPALKVALVNYLLNILPE